MRNVFRANIFKFSLGAAVVLVGSGGSLGSAWADPEALSFCMPSEATIRLSALTPGIEVGIVVTSTGAGPQYDELKANNYYEKGAGGAWNAALPAAFEMPNGGCADIVIRNKPTPPEGDSSWQCNNIGYAKTSIQTSVLGTMPGTTIQTSMVMIPGESSQVQLKKLDSCDDVR